MKVGHFTLLVLLIVTIALVTSSSANEDNKADVTNHHAKKVHLRVKRDSSGEDSRSDERIISHLRVKRSALSEENGSKTSSESSDTSSESSDN